MFWFLCTAWTIHVIATKSSSKDFKEITIILLSFLSSKCKKNASVFQLSKPQWHYFCIQMGQKIYLYISLYKYIHANVVGVQYLPLLLAVWNNTTTKCHPNSWITRRNEQRTRELQVETPGLRITDGRNYKHACADHLLDTFKQTVFTQYLLSNPFNPLIAPSSTLLSQTLVSAFAIWSVSISIITYTKSRETYYWI